MYVKKIQLINYGPIEGLEIDCPFGGDNPHPIILVGENGSGKSILLSQIVNVLLCAQQVAYPGTPEVSQGMVYKLRSPRYIRSGKDFSFAQVDLESNISVAELQLAMQKRDYGSTPLGILGTDAEQLWNAMDPTETSYFSPQLDEVNIKALFEHNCVLYFPSNRFEDPAWLNEANLNAQARHIDSRRVRGETKRTVLNYSPLHDNQNFLFELAFDARSYERFTPNFGPIYDGLNADKEGFERLVYQLVSGRAKTFYNAAIQVLQSIVQGQAVRLGMGTRIDRAISVIDNERTRVPNIFQLSSGEVSLLNIFLSILRDFDSCQAQVAKPEDIRGIVVIDEVDLHLHAMYQYTILPKLIQMFPRVQFVLTTHSPLVVLGLHRVLGDERLGLYRLPNGERITPETFSEFESAYRAFAQTNTYFSEMQAAIRKTERPLIFVEGITDVEYLNRAIALRGYCEVFAGVEIREAGGEGNLKNAWRTFTKMDIVRHTVILLHDCDSNESADDCCSVFRRKMSMVKDHPICKGIENLFSEDTLNRAKAHKPGFIDIVEKHKKTVRGSLQEIPEKWDVNKNEKSSLCNWICQNGTREDFRSFDGILDELRKIPGLLRPVKDELG